MSNWIFALWSTILSTLTCDHVSWTTAHCPITRDRTRTKCAFLPEMNPTWPLIRHRGSIRGYCKKKASISQRYYITNGILFLCFHQMCTGWGHLYSWLCTEPSDVKGTFPSCLLFDLKSSFPPINASRKVISKMLWLIVLISIRLKNMFVLELFY